MARKRILLAAPLALGILVLIWALGTAREPRPAKAPVRPAPAVAAADSRGPAAAPAPVAAPAVAAKPGSYAAESGAIRARILALEARLRDLEARRDELAESNRDLERRVAEKGAEAGALAQAEWRVKAWEKLLGLTDLQRREVLELAKAWAREDGVRKAGRETWAAREDDLRSRLTTEQSSRLNQHATDLATRMWSQMGQTLGGFAGMTAEERSRLQPSLGDFRLPNTAMLPEAHGADWTAMIRAAAGRVRPSLTPAQAERVDRYLARF